jgi:NAD(P)-dependent dehydrogenase (short-subunit alcohol dehydrogenase family)
MGVAVVTGANSGIGRATALGLARAGFHVIAAGRSVERTAPVLAEIEGERGTAEFVELDLASLGSVRAAARKVVASGHAVDVLVNNAGIGVNRRGLTEDGFEVHFGINHLGHFLLTNELGPVLDEGARVVSLTSAMHHRAEGIDLARTRRPTRGIGLTEYAISKLANVLFISELARRRPELRAYAVHPGLVRTRLIPAPIRAFTSGMLSPEQGADTVLWCATTGDVAHESGGYYQQRTRLPASAVGQDDELATGLWDQSELWCEEALGSRGRGL